MSGKKKEQSVQISEPREYHLFELVWAKIVGYPWWPAKIIGKDPKNPNSSYCLPSKLKPFVYGENPPVNMKTASKQLNQAFQIFNRQFENAVLLIADAKKEQNQEIQQEVQQSDEKQSESQTHQSEVVEITKIQFSMSSKPQVNKKPSNFQIGFQRYKPEKKA